MTVTNELLQNNEAYAAAFDEGHLPMPPSKEVAVVACMDARLDVYKILGLELGEAHVIRNAGGVVSEDAIRSLVISQRLLGTQEIILVHHTDCGMLTFQDHEVKTKSSRTPGHDPILRSRPSPMWKTTFGNRSSASRPTRSSPTRTKFVGSCSM